MSAQLADDELLITRTFNAPAALMFALWTDATHFKNWMGPQGFACEHADFDVRIGGRYRAMIKSAEYGESWFGGEYREIEQNTRLVFTFKWDDGPAGGIETLITITFEERDGKTTQIFHQTPFLDVERRDSHVGGWNSAFDCAESYAERIIKEHAA